jgi:alpha/beta superfamily hydrolase
VGAALKFLSDQGKSSIDLAGYSFGAWVNALGAGELEQARRMVMVSPPVNFVSFDFLKYNPKIQLVIVGNRDDIAGYKAIEKLMPNWNPEATLRIIEGADHFYWGYTEELKAIIGEFLENE